MSFFAPREPFAKRSVWAERASRKLFSLNLHFREENIDVFAMFSLSENQKVERRKNRMGRPGLGCLKWSFKMSRLKPEFKTLFEGRKCRFLPG